MIPTLRMGLPNTVLICHFSLCKCSQPQIVNFKASNDTRNAAPENISSSVKPHTFADRSVRRAGYNRNAAPGNAKFYTCFVCHICLCNHCMIHFYSHSQDFEMPSSWC